MTDSFGTYDYIIVGAGTAGCVLANRLSADPDVSVLLVEAGGRDGYFWIHVPIGYLYTQNNPRTDWCFKTEPEPGLNGRALNYARGRVLGGCSSGWSWDDVLPYFKRSEDYVHGADEFHGAGGEWRVEEQRLSWPLLDAFRDAAAAVGIPRTNDFNRGDNEGCGYFQVNQKAGIRWSTAKAFLRPVLRRPNLRVVIHAPAKVIRFDGRRAIGVEFWQDGIERFAEARHEVILTTGAIGSPQLLQLSGVGPAALLREHGIAVRHDLPGVGENLQDHLQIRTVYKVKGIPTLNERANRLAGRIGMGLEYALFRRGPLTMAPSPLGCFARSDPSRDTPDLQYHIQPLSLDRFGEPLHPFPAFTASVCPAPDQPRLRAHQGPDPRAQPAIRPKYLATPEDRAAAAAAIRLTRRICAAEPLAKYVTEEYRPGPQIQSDAELVKAAGDIGTTIFHPVATCKMGTDPTAVVDPRLRVHNLESVRVVDASIMPTITSGNTNAPTIMIAEKAADMIREDRKP
jgi:choline dehydrogenase